MTTLKKKKALASNPKRHSSNSKRRRRRIDMDITHPAIVANTTKRKEVGKLLGP
jgi:hypothetical protein